MNESDLKRALVKILQGEGTYARRIEDRFLVGFPDLIIIPQDQLIFFCEAKIVSGKSFKPRDRQFIELQRLSVSWHAVACVLGFDGPSTYLHPYAKICPLDKCVQKYDDETFTQFFVRFSGLRDFHL